MAKSVINVEEARKSIVKALLDRIFSSRRSVQAQLQAQMRGAGFSVTDVREQNYDFSRVPLSDLMALLNHLGDKMKRGVQTVLFGAIEDTLKNGGGRPMRSNASVEGEMARNLLALAKAVSDDLSLLSLVRAGMKDAADRAVEATLADLRGMSGSSQVSAEVLRGVQDSFHVKMPALVEQVVALSAAGQAVTQEEIVECLRGQLDCRLMRRVVPPAVQLASVPEPVGAVPSGVEVEPLAQLEPGEVAGESAAPPEVRSLMMNLFDGARLGAPTALSDRASRALSDRYHLGENAALVLKWFMRAGVQSLVTGEIGLPLLISAVSLMIEKLSASQASSLSALALAYSVYSEGMMQLPSLAMNFMGFVAAYSGVNAAIDAVSNWWQGGPPAQAAP